MYDPVTGEITNSDELKDELKFDVEKFNKTVIAKELNKAVLEEISKDINPEGEGKTLIYAVNDLHADSIVDLLREIYEPQGIDQDAIMKITGSIGDKKRVEEAIRCFKNEKYPNIAVTVDLLTTGIDVPEITTLVFLRHVHSRILFEQMLGRATRLCERIGKTHFEIYDTVGVYKSLQDISTMKPVVVSPETNFDDLIKGLDLPTEKQIKNQINIIVAKMRRKLKNLSDTEKKQFEIFSNGKNPEQFIEELLTATTNQAKEIILKSSDIFELLSNSKGNGKQAIVISDKKDEVISHARGYGDGKKPQDYLEEFRKFITENIEIIEPLRTVCTNPSSLTRQGLREIEIILEQKGFTNKQLNGAWKDLKNKAVEADIITWIRAEAIGSNMINSEERIKNAFKMLKDNHKFSKIEIDWLSKIETNLIKEKLLTEETFNTGAFRDIGGGFVGINKRFNGKLKEYITELNNYLYDDGGK